jgi:tRNA(fMet)-specific endonuclease VapC
LIGMIGNKVLLDTNAIIALQRENESIRKLLRVASDVFIPVIAIGELYFGAYKSQRVEDNRKAVSAFTENRIILRTDENTADMYGQIKQQLRDKGRPIPENDIWIAACAIQYDLVLLTQDKHFEAVDNLITIGW